MQQRVQSSIRDKVISQTQQSFTKATTLKEKIGKKLNKIAEKQTVVEESAQEAEL